MAVLDTPSGYSVTSDLLLPSCALLLVVNVSCSFRDTDMEAVEKQLEAGGRQMWSRAAVLFSYGDWLGDTSIEQRIESEGGPLQRLVDKCGNRYHVLDNKQRGGGAQVDELMELIEEMLVGERLDVLHRGGHVWESVVSAGERRPGAVTLRTRDVRQLRSCRHQLSSDCESNSCTHFSSVNILVTEVHTDSVRSGRWFVTITNKCSSVTRSYSRMKSGKSVNAPHRTA